MPRLHGFPPVVGDSPVVLLLGTFPGPDSLKGGGYYLHPRNQFWTIIGRWLHFPDGLTPSERQARLAGSGIALWDVLAACRRTGSADAAIVDPRPNHIVGFLARHPSIGLIGFNGRRAAFFHRSLIGPVRLPSLVLPSTSPAAARMPLTAKLAAWGELFERARLGD